MGAVARCPSLVASAMVVASAENMMGKILSTRCRLHLSAFVDHSWFHRGWKQVKLQCDPVIHLRVRCLGGL
jgi:hypothetical protein